MSRMDRFLIRASIVLALLSPAAAAASAFVRSSPQSSLAHGLAGTLASVGGSSGAEVVDLGSGRILFSSAPNSRRLPASVEKVYTTSTALSQFGPGGTLSTRIFATGRTDSHGVFRGVLYLRGGGDPTFGSASYDRFAYGTGATIQRLVATLRHQTGIRAIQGAIVGDGTYFDSRPGTPATGFAVSSYLEGVLGGLSYDRGFADEHGSSFQDDPPLFAAERLRDALRAGGVSVPNGTPVRIGRTPSNAVSLATVHSPSISTLVRLTNTPSDNYLAEMLLKDLGASAGRRGSTAAGAAVVARQLATRFGIHPRVLDGSGLSRADATSPADMIAALRGLSSDRTFVNSLSIAGETGTMQAGLAGTAAQGRCQGKTGTLHDVASLAGYCTTRRGRRLAFAFLENAVDPVAGHASEDRMAVLLATYTG